MRGDGPKDVRTRFAEIEIEGEVIRDAEIDQIVFEITSMLFQTNFAWILTEDERVLDRARLGVEHVLARVTRPSVKRPT